MLPKITALALCVLAAPLAAETHTVVLNEAGFFPDTVYVANGDTITFTNSAGQAVTVEASDQSWSTAEIADAAAGSIAVATGMAQSFRFATNHQAAGAMSFEPAPLQ